MPLLTGCFLRDKLVRELSHLLPRAEAFADPPEEPQAAFRAPTVFRAAALATFGPLWQRFRLGEGGLLAINASLVWVTFGASVRTAVHVVACTVVLALLYAFNDLWDVGDDVRDPKKDQRLVALLLAHRAAFFVWFVGLLAACAVACGAFVGARAAAAVVGVAIVNVLYSAWLKRVPAVDVLWVGVWGGSYAAVTEARWELCAIVGLMTATSHVFQAQRDRSVDVENRILTIAVFSQRLALAMLAGCSVLLVVALMPFVGWAVALAGLVPLGCALIRGRGGAMWIVSKATLAAAWVAVLLNQHAVG